VAIKDMWVRGAGLIGAAAAFGMYLAVCKEEDLLGAAKILRETRPTAVNLSWALDRMLKLLLSKDKQEDRLEAALQEAQNIANEDAENCRLIGEQGLSIIKDIHQKKKGKTVNILTHCNAGWLAFVDYGTALSPIYAAQAAGVPVHVWVDETRPRNQGAKLTAWELHQQGIPYTVIADNTGGHLMQHQMVDMVIVGSDRTTRNGDVANKIGTYLKALAAADNNIPFYAALPSSTIDWSIIDGVKNIPIEQRNAREVKYMEGTDEKGEWRQILIAPKHSPAANYGFDVTPARLITGGIITERGIAQASEDSLLSLFPEKAKNKSNKPASSH